MFLATQKITLAPRRMLSVQEAAEYCGLTVRQFRAECAVQPVALAGKTLLIDVRDLDAWIDSKKSGHANDDDTIIGKLVG